MRVRRHALRRLRRWRRLLRRGLLLTERRSRTGAARLDELTLEQLEQHAEQCPRCPLSGSRTSIVFGSGNPDADVMLVGEAPGYHEDRIGEPFVSEAGELLTSLLHGIGYSRDDVYLTNVLKCRPPHNRKPRREETQHCEGYLFQQVALVKPLVICTLGDFATRLLTAKPQGVGLLHGVPLSTTLQSRRLIIYPLYHPAAALYTASLLQTLRSDFRRIPALVRAAASLDAGELDSRLGGRPAPPVPAAPIDTVSRFGQVAEQLELELENQPLLT